MPSETAEALKQALIKKGKNPAAITPTMEILCEVIDELVEKIEALQAKLTANGIL